MSGNSRIEKLRQVSISEIMVSGMNEEIYRPVRFDDPEIIALAESIRKNGLLKPLVISSDGYLLDGHRRRAACKIAGVKSVRCEVNPVTIDDPEFMILLREYNRQRVKGIDEIIREEIIDATTDEKEIAEQLIIERTKKSYVSLDSIEIVGIKKRASIKGNRSLLDAAIKIIHQLQDFWPLSDRIIHYHLLNDPPLKHKGKPDSIYKNDRDSYTTLTNVLTRGRLNGEILWHSIADETRPIVTWDVYPDITPFVSKELKKFMSGYFRDYMQSQPNHIEIIGEKLTIESIIRPVAMRYCIPYTIGRGYSSINPRHDMAQRFKKSGKSMLVILILSDFDPDGDEIAQSFSRSMRDDFGVNVYPIRVALTQNQIIDLKLPASTEKAKKKSSNYYKFIARYGSDDVYELEAIPPKKLQEFLTQAIESTVDVTAINSEMKLEEKEFLKLAQYRKKALESIASQTV